MVSVPLPSHEVWTELIQPRSIFNARRQEVQQGASPPPAPPTEHMFWWGGDTVTEVTNHSRWVEAQGERNV